jgi:mannosyltransferase
VSLLTTHARPARHADTRAHAAGRAPVARVAVAPTLLMLALGFLGLGHRQPWDDERATWWAAGLSWNDLGRLVQHVDIVLAPYYVLMHLWIDVFGDSAAAMRAPSVLAMAAAAGLLAVLGTWLFDAGVGTAAGLVFAALPISTRYAQEARPYAFAVLAALASTLLLLRALDRSAGPGAAGGGWAAYALSIPWMGLTHLVTLGVLAAHLTLLLSRADDGTRLGRGRAGLWTTAVAFGVLPLLPVIVLGAGQTGQVAWIPTGWPALSSFPQQLFHSQTAAVAVIGTALLGLAASRRWAGFLLCWALLPPLFLFAVQGVVNLFLMRYLLYTCPAWVLLAAVGLCAGVRRLPERAVAWAPLPRDLLAAVGAVLLLTLVCIPDIQAVRSNPLPGDPDWHAAAQWILGHEQPGDGIAYSGTSGYRQLSMSYEFRDVPRPPRDVFEWQTPQSLGEFMASDCPDPTACARGVPRIWLVASGDQSDPYAKMPTREADLLKSGYHQAGSHRVAGLRILLLDRSHH